MADFSTLIASIEATIKQNGVQAITGQVLQDELLLMVSAMNQLKQDTLEGYSFYGEALPNGATKVVTQNTFFLAGAGSYTINGNAVTISDGGISVIVYDCVNDEITTYLLFAYDANPTSGSANAVTSGGVKSALDAKADKDGAFPDLFAGYAGNLVDTRSAGTPQGPYAFRQSGGDGVDYMVRIKGRTEAFNQLVGPSDTQVTIPSGHLYYAIINGTASVGTSDGTPIAVTGGTDIVVDLTLEGLGFTTADQFRALHPLPYYNYNAGVLKNNAATGLETTGFNQWDGEKTEGVAINASTGEEENNAVCSATDYIPIFPNTTYYFRKCGLGSGVLGIAYYDGNKTYISGNVTGESAGAYFTRTTPENAAFMRVSFRTDYVNEICINLSWSGYRNGEYEPYEKHTLNLPLNAIACHNGDTAVTVNGLDGVGNVYDEAVVENGYVTKIIKRFAEVDLGDLNWIYTSGANSRMEAIGVTGIKNPANDSTKANIISAKFMTVALSSVYNHSRDKIIAVHNLAPNIWVYDSAYSDAATFKTAMAGVKLRYELATPLTLTVDTPFPALVEVDNLGTEKRLPEDTADNPQAPFESDSNYSISTANLVRKLSE